MHSWSSPPTPRWQKQDDRVNSRLEKGEGWRSKLQWDDINAGGFISDSLQRFLYRFHFNTRFLARVPLTIRDPNTHQDLPNHFWVDLILCDGFSNSVNVK